MGSKDRRQRFAVLIYRQGGRCALCSELMCPSCHPPCHARATFDHIIPYRDGGRHWLANLRLVHYVCNMKREGQVIFGSDRECPISRKVFIDGKV